MQKKSFRLYLIITGVLIIGVVILLFVFQKSLNFKKPAKFVYPVETITSSIMEQEEEACFRFLWENTNTNPDSHGYGLVLDRSSNPSMCSVASVGYALAGCAIGEYRGYISEQEAKERAELTLHTLLENAEQEEGFFYHFLDMQTAKRYGTCEVSVIDTGIAISGALFAGEYFGGEIKELAKQLYLRVNWEWYRNPDTNQFYMEYLPEKGYHTGSWGVYAEQLMLYFLSAASETHPVPSDMLYQINRQKNLWIGMPSYIMSPANSLFTHQYSHAWFPLKNTVDNLGTDWYANSTFATLQARQFCIDTSSVFKTFGENSWGLSACDGPNGYNGGYGANPDNRNDGTVAFCGAIGSAPFDPESVSNAISYYYGMEDVIGTYGLVDAYNLEGDSPKIMKDYLGIDKGISLVMLENARSGLIWEYMSKNIYVKEGMRLVGITPANQRLIENADGISNYTDITITGFTCSKKAPDQEQKAENMSLGTALEFTCSSEDSTGQISFENIEVLDYLSQINTVHFSACGSFSITAKLFNAKGTLLSQSKPLSVQSNHLTSYELSFPSSVILEDTLTLTFEITSKQNTFWLDELTFSYHGDWIRNVAVSERPYVGALLHAQFDYFSESNKKCYVTYEWQKSDSVDGEFSSISGAVTPYYTPTKEDIGQFLRVVITPVNAERETIGNSCSSTNFCVVTETLPTVTDSILQKVKHNKPTIN